MQCIAKFDGIYKIILLSCLHRPPRSQGETETAGHIKNKKATGCLIFAGLIPAIVLIPSTLIARELPAPDWRNIQTGYEIPSENYVDQPYVVITKDGNWLCTLTTGRGREGNRGQHIAATVSSDRGRTWSNLIDIEPADGPEASWAMPLVTPSGRIYVFYIYNADQVETHPDGRRIRADILGWYCYKYSDDNGEKWSKRYRLPVRLTACDRANDWMGKVQLMWGIGKPIANKDSVFFGFTKLGRYMLDNGEGWFFRSDNILTELDVPRIKWQMLPDGEHGVRTPGFGSIQEEHNLVALSNGDLYCMYRATTGHPVHSYSRDGGHSWSKPELATYMPGGRKFKHPRACPRIWRANGPREAGTSGRFLFWFHNHGGKDYTNRNPAWISAGTEKSGFIHWSQPEILLYDPDPKVRISYPDFIEQDGHYWVTETQKTTARVHEIDHTLLEGLWQQGQTKKIATEGLVFSMDAATLKAAATVDMPRLPNLTNGGGFTIDLRIRFDDLTGGQVVLDCRDGKGIALTTTDVGTLRLDLSDGKHKASWDCDQQLLRANKLHHVVFIVDGGPKIISILVDGALCDGRRHRQYGWGRFRKELGDINGASKLKIAPSMSGELRYLRIYDRYLRTSEAVGNFQAGV